MSHDLNFDWPEFLATHWQKRPVVLRQGFVNFIDQNKNRNRNFIEFFYQKFERFSFI